MPIQIPQNAIWYDAVQIVLLLLIGFAVLWLAAQAWSTNTRLAKLETIVGNEYNHRFSKLKRHLGVKWDDDLPDPEDESDSRTS